MKLAQEDWVCPSCNEKAERYQGSKRSACRRCELFKEMTRTYGITREEYENLVEEQKNVCRICGNPETSTRNGNVRLLAVDHNHTTGKVRGLLCSRCNVGLGYFKDDPELLEKAIEYIRESS